MFILQDRLVKIRHSATLLIVIVFITMMFDLMTIAFFLPVLPRILSQFYCSKTNNASLDSVILNSSATIVNSTSADVLVCDDDTISTHVGWIVGAGPFAEVIVSFFLGSFIRYFGNKTTLNLGALSGICGILSLLLVDGEWGLYFGRIVQGIGSTLSTVAGLGLMAKTVKDEHRISSFATVYMGMPMGFLIGSTLGGVLYQYTGRHWPFFVLFLLSLVDLMLRQCIVVDKHDEDSDEKAEQSIPYAKTFSDVYIILMLFGTCITFFVPTCIMAMLPHHLADRATASQIGLFYSLATAFEFLSQCVATKLVKTHCSRVFLIFISFCLHSTGLLLLLFPMHIWLYVIPLCLTRAGEGLYCTMASSLYAYISDVRALDCINFLYTLYVGAYSFGNAIGPVITGYLIPLVGFPTTCFILMWLTVLQACLTLLLFRMKNTRIIVSETTGLTDTRK